MEETPRPLWAPWRVEFIRGEREKRCFLCDNDAPSGKPGTRWSSGAAEPLS